MMTSSPMLDVNSGTRSLSPKKAGIPSTHTAPSTAPVTEPSPPITAMPTTRSESSTWNSTCEKRMFCTKPPSSAPPKPASPPARPNAVSFALVGLTV